MAGLCTRQSVSLAFWGRIAASLCLSGRQHGHQDVVEWGDSAPPGACMPERDGGAPSWQPGTGRRCSAAAQPRRPAVAGTAGAAAAICAGRPARPGTCASSNRGPLWTDQHEDMSLVLSYKKQCRSSWAVCACPPWRCLCSTKHAVLAASRPGAAECTAHTPCHTVRPMLRQARQGTYSAE